MDFRNQLSRQHKSKVNENDLCRSQRACRQIDQSKGFTEPVEVWFWPDDDDNIDDDGFDDEHHDEERNNESGTDEAEEEEIEESYLEEPKALSPADTYRTEFKKPKYGDEFLPEEQLQMITEYLRAQYRYCLWCGITFSDSDDMKNTCPGSTRDDQDE